MKNTSGNRRCGVSRRSFSYADHIPERRVNSDRRKNQECDLDIDEQSKQESEKNTFPRS